MTQHRTVGLCAASVLMATGVLGAANTSASADARPARANASQEGEVSTQDVGFCKRPPDGAAWWSQTTKPRVYKGRTAILYTESAHDLQAYGYAKDIATGDKVSVQRSNQPYRMGDKPKYPSTATINGSGGYRGCSVKANWYDANVRDYIKSRVVQLQTGGGKYSYAVRTCIYPAGGGKGCTKWFVDHK